MPNAIICTPGNPSGKAKPWPTKNAGRKSEEARFCLSDECYSELYRDEAKPPAGILEACDAMNHFGYNCPCLHSLSKRSNLPGLRSGFVAGDPELIKRFLQYQPITVAPCHCLISMSLLPPGKTSSTYWKTGSSTTKSIAVSAELKSVLPIKFRPAFISGLTFKETTKSSLKNGCKKPTSRYCRASTYRERTA